MNGKLPLRLLGEDDGGPSMQPNLDLQVSQGNPNSLAKVQGMTHILLGSKSEGPGFESQQRPTFVHVIS